MTPRQTKAGGPVHEAAIALLKDLFEKSELNRDELAKKAGVPAGTLAGLFAGTKPLYADQLVALAHALGADGAEVMRQLEAVHVAQRRADELAAKRAARKRQVPGVAAKAARTHKKPGE